MNIAVINSAWLFLTFFLGVINTTYCQRQNIKFSHIGTEDGLFQGNVIKKNEIKY
jgi:hypothetical protein